VPGLCERGDSEVRLLRCVQYVIGLSPRCAQSGCAGPVTRSTFALRTTCPRACRSAGTILATIARTSMIGLAAGHTDMRKGFDGLAALVQETLKRNPHDGHLFVFRGRSGGLIKVLWHDGQGMCLFAKRLERGRFVWPLTVPQEDADQTVTITSAQLGYLLEGIDWRLPQHTWRPQAAG
jgi:transposase